jgi:hypothetical protein
MLWLSGCPTVRQLRGVTVAGSGNSFDAARRRTRAVPRRRSINNEAMTAR